MPQLNPSATPIVVEGQDSPLLEILTRILQELRGLRLATVALACESGKNKETDFDPTLGGDISLPT